MQKYVESEDGTIYECEMQAIDASNSDWFLYCRSLQKEPIANIWFQTLFCNQYARLDGYMWRVYGLEKSQQTDMGKVNIDHAIYAALQSFLSLKNKD